MELKTQKVSSQDLSTINLETSDIEDILSFYENKHIYVKKATITGNKLNATFKFFKFPFQKIAPEHLTREQAVLFITQATYILALKYKELDSNWPLSKSFGKRLAVTEQMAFSKIDINFKKFIRNTEDVSLQLTFESYKILNHKLYVNISFSFNNNCFGEIKGICALDESFTID